MIHKYTIRLLIGSEKANKMLNPTQGSIAALRGKFRGGAG